MEEAQASGVLFLMFALRCIAPLVLTLGIGYLMNRLVDRWEAEESQREDTVAPIPATIPVAASTTPSGSGRPAITIPCWILRNCDEVAQADCAARKQPSIPCWLARLRAEGQLPDGCPDCEIYEEGGLAPVV
jgi:hypothetical protein